MTCVGIIQPNFLPWRGYFDFIQMCDAFVFLDTVQYTKHDWRNRNRIRTRQGPSVWLTVPVTRGTFRRSIRDVELSVDQDWRRAHLNLLREHYGHAPFHSEVEQLLETEYRREWTHLSPFTIALTRRILAYLGITTPVFVASELGTSGDREGRLIDLVKRLGGTSYISGPAARGYIKPEVWEAAGIDLVWKSYEGYLPYGQIAEPYDPMVSVVDLLFMKGPAAREYVWGDQSKAWRERRIG